MNMNNHNAREKISQGGSLKVKLFPNFNPFTKDKGGGGLETWKFFPNNTS